MRPSAQQEGKRKYLEKKSFDDKRYEIAKYSRRFFLFVTAIKIQLFFRLHAVRDVYVVSFTNKCCTLRITERKIRKNEMSF